MLTRRAFPEIFYEGVNITKNLEKDILSFSYTDVASGAADTISISIQDKNKKWLSDWAPTQGDKVEVNIKTINWKEEGDNGLLKCGTFIIDEPSYRGKPTVFTLNGISLPNNSNFTDTKKSKTWNNATLQKIAETIANKAGLELVFDSDLNPTINFTEQSETSDKTFLFDLCQKYGLAMKLFNQKIVIFDETKYEEKDSVITINESDTEKWEIKPTLTEAGYDSCKIEYFDSEEEKLRQYTYKPPGSQGKKLLKINEIVYSIADAEMRAKAELRKANKNETKITITIPGNTELVASNTVDLAGFGKYSGKYYIDRIVHQLNAYKLDINLHKVLGGY